jgi:hypothetical protein
MRDPNRIQAASLIIGRVEAKQLMKTNQLIIARRLLLLTGCLLATGPIQAQISITGGDLYVYQAGDGTTAAGSGVGAPVYIDQFSTAQGASDGTLNSFLAQTALPTTAGFGVNLLSSGQSPQDGGLFFSAASDTLVFGGYSGTAVNSSFSTANRDIGQVNASGTFSFAVQNSAQYNGSGGLLRSAITDGNNNYWASGTTPNGGGQGVWYYGAGTPAALIGSATATRGLETYGGNIFYTTGSGVNMITGQPQSGTQTPSLLFAAGSTPYGFTFSPNMLTAFVANESGGIIQATYSGTFSGGAYSGGTWTTTTIDSGTDFDWVTADFSGANPVIYATTLAGSGGNKLEEIVDNGSDPVTILDTITGASTASGNFDGIVFVPGAVPEPSVYALAGFGLLLFLGKWPRAGKT